MKRDIVQFVKMSVRQGRSVNLELQTVTASIFALFSKRGEEPFAAGGLAMKGVRKDLVEGQITFLRLAFEMHPGLVSLSRRRRTTTVWARLRGSPRTFCMKCRTKWSITSWGRTDNRRHQCRGLRQGCREGRCKARRRRRGLK